MRRTARVLITGAGDWWNWSRLSEEALSGFTKQHAGISSQSSHVGRQFWTTVTTRTNILSGSEESLHRQLALSIRFLELGVNGVNRQKHVFLRSRSWCMATQATVNAENTKTRTEARRTKQNPPYS
jgi:lysophospholipase L1-like esterase